MLALVKLSNACVLVIAVFGTVGTVAPDKAVPLIYLRLDRYPLITFVLVAWEYVPIVGMRVISVKLVVLALGVPAEPLHHTVITLFALETQKWFQAFSCKVFALAIGDPAPLMLVVIWITLDGAFASTTK